MKRVKLTLPDPSAFTTFVARLREVKARTTGASGGGGGGGGAADGGASGGGGGPAGVCGGCGTAVTARFCGNCGAEQETKPPPAGAGAGAGAGAVPIEMDVLKRLCGLFPRTRESGSILQVGGWCVWGARVTGGAGE
jgi:hypothetical protein